MKFSAKSSSRKIQHEFLHIQGIDYHLKICHVTYDMLEIEYIMVNEIKLSELYIQGISPPSSKFI